MSDFFRTCVKIIRRNLTYFLLPLLLALLAFAVLLFTLGPAVVER